jgi:hypothetical protein
MIKTEVRTQKNWVFGLYSDGKHKKNPKIHEIQDPEKNKMVGNAFLRLKTVTPHTRKTALRVS